MRQLTFNGKSTTPDWGAAGQSRTTTLVARLRGSAEVPGPGDPDGRGRALITITLPNELCYRISVSGIALPATAAHIHRGVAGRAGDIVVTLGAPSATGKSAGCVPDVDSTLLRRIVRNPQNYYVNVHNGEFPAGAVRGQLAA